jgi:PPOX class probable F420-dependent enzyme
VPFAIDTSTDFGKKVERRLRDEHLAWITTVSADGTPQPNPVWFLWENGVILVVSKPDAVKLRHIERRPRVGFNLEGGADGEDIVVLTGSATVSSEPLPAATIEAYLAKYHEDILALGMTDQQMLAEYNVTIRITPEKLRGW